MSMASFDLAARSVQRAAETDRAVLAALAAAGDVGLRPGRELAEAVRLPKPTARDSVNRLVARGLAGHDGRRRVWATEAGCSEAGAGAPGLSLAPALDAAVACLPAEALRAFARLQLAAVTARWHLAGAYNTGWCGFIALGPTKTAKTSVASLVCRVYGLDELAAVKIAQHETPGSLFARRVRDSASATGYRLERSPLLELPYVCVDEWDKAPSEVRAAAGGLLLGSTAAELEGERFTIRPTVYVTLNTGPEGLDALHEAHVRRSVVLNTAPLRQLLDDIDEDMARLFGGGRLVIPRLALQRVRPAVSELPAELRQMLRVELRAGLTDAGWQHTDVEPLARVAVGRAALTGSELDQAVLATALDYLSCAATLGHVVPGFAARIAGQLGAVGSLLPDAAAAVDEQGRKRQLEAGREQTRAHARLAFHSDREGKTARALEARDMMGRARDIQRQEIAAALTAAAADLRGARTPEALETAWQATLPYIDRAQAWKTARDAAANIAADARHRAELVRAARRREPTRRASIPSQPAAAAPAPAASAGLPAMFAAFFDPLLAARRAAPVGQRPRVAPAGQGPRVPQGWCPTCGTTYNTRGNFGTTITRCGRCWGQLQPVR
jgi:hypothetical protein